MANIIFNTSTVNLLSRRKSESDLAQVEKTVDFHTQIALQQKPPARSKSYEKAGFTSLGKRQSPASQLPPAAANRVFELTETPDGLILTVDPATLKAGIHLPSGCRRVTKLVCHGLDVMPKILPIPCQKLDFSNSPGLVIPDHLIGYGKIKSLNLSGCDFSEFPNIFKMECLEIFNLDSNEIKIIPEKISALKKLEDFSIQNNKLESLPSAFGEFLHLKVLTVRNNAIIDVPDILNLSIFPYVEAAGDQQKEMRLLTEKEFHDLSNAQLTKVLFQLNHAIHTLKQEWLGSQAPAAKHPRWCKVKDTVFVAALVQAENKLTKGLNARRTSSAWEAAREILKLAKNAQKTHQTINMRLVAEIGRENSLSSEDHFTHSIAIDVRVIPDESGPKISLVSLEQTDHKDMAKKFLKYISEVLGNFGLNNVKSSINNISIQKTEFGCSIFSLSIAKKMHKHQQVLNALHDQALSGDTEKTIELPLDFYKHTTSNSTLNALEEAGLNVDSVPVNQAGHSLRQRAQLGRRTRTHPNFPDGLAYNTGIEAKRIQFFEKACFVLQEEARRRRLAIDPAIHLYDGVPTSSVLPRLMALTAEAQPPYGFA
jgi:hypothetical protein